VFAVFAVMLLACQQTVSALNYDDLTAEQKSEVSNQKAMLKDMFAQMEGLSEDEQKEKVKTFSQEEQHLLQAYFEHKNNQNPAAGAQQQQQQQQQPQQPQMSPEDQASLGEMFSQLEGLTEEEQKAKVQAFTPQQQQLLKTYFQKKKDMEQASAQEIRRLSPEEQQTLIKELYARMEGKTYGEQESIVKKFTTQEKDLWDRYNSYQKEQQEKFEAKRAKELGLCETDAVYTVKKKGVRNFNKPKIGDCQRIHLWDDEIGDKGAEALAAEMIVHADKFISLSMDTTDVETEGAIHLAAAVKACQKMVAIDLDSNSIGDEGVQALVESITDHPAMTTFGLAHNGITDVGAAALLKMLRTNYLVATMPLHGNQISKSVKAEIDALLEKNRELAEKTAQKEAAKNASSTTANEIDDVEIVEVDADHEEL